MLSLTLLLIPACQNAEDDSQIQAQVTGTLNIKDGNSLQDISEAHVMLIDYSIADASYVLIAETSITELDHLPIEFSIPYNSAEIKESNFYGISASLIKVNGDGDEIEIYTSTQSYPVLTNGFGDETHLILEKIH
ncbi:hypothetical protein YC6258_02092 [Gynuella sunshinyii YC6258]|uniref:Lipoprotein n=2 Tax=Gynuella sunshinyii TaxID=1445505 RepID=A0A0C5VUR3_9GAMM|nr:hypothetical protein YC6258_02092 [Gynuella sunshinyii YC6258]